MATILIVDDNKRNLQVLGNILYEQKYKVAMAMDGPTALKLTEKINPDLIILDIMMPGMDGFEVCSILKANTSTKGIPILFLTAKVDIEDIVKGFKLGGADYVNKPFKKEELLARISNQIELVISKKKIEEQAIELQATNKFKSKLFSIIGHDLRGSISSLNMTLDLILNGHVKCSDDDFLEIIGKLLITTSESYSLLDNLLYWGKSGSGNQELRKEKIDINLMANQTINLFQLNLQNKEITVKNKLTDDAVVFADLLMIQIIFRNLFSNAIKFTNKNGSITISSKEIDGKNFVSIEDTGVGIPKENLNKLFDNNGQIQTKGTNNEKGSGLGLILCKDFTEKNGGELSVKSEFGKGSKFTFSLPIDGE